MIEKFPLPKKNQNPEENQKLETNQNPENIETLNQKVEEINLVNLDLSDLEKLQEMQTLKEDIMGKSHEITEKFQSRLDTFLDEISDAYSEEELNKTALIHILKGTEIPSEVEYLDLEGSYSVQEFLQGLVNELEEGTL